MPGSAGRGVHDGYMAPMASMGLNFEGSVGPIVRGSVGPRVCRSDGSEGPIGPMVLCVDAPFPLVTVRFL